MHPKSRIAAALAALAAAALLASPVHAQVKLRYAHVGVANAPQTLYADEVEVARRHPHDQVLLGDDPQYEVLTVLPLDLARLDVLDDCGPVIWIDNRFADGESHM